MIALQGAIFYLKAQIAFKLQDLAYQTTDLIAFRKTLVEDMVRKVRELNKENFAVRQHLKYVERYAELDSYNALTYEDTLLMGQELAPLITPEEDDAKRCGSTRCYTASSLHTWRERSMARRGAICSKRFLPSHLWRISRRSWCRLS